MSSDDELGASLPPGPRMPRTLQTAIWFRRAQWLMAECARRFGDTFTLRILHEGAWVLVSHPDHVKHVFTGDPRVFHAGEPDELPPKSTDTRLVRPSPLEEAPEVSEPVRSTVALQLPHPDAPLDPTDLAVRPARARRHAVE